nr:integrase, catalytic region, zinc finger, CCHC-type, peptidase aspartic, catalytic [Tanacetum cinerariifolium]
ESDKFIKSSVEDLVPIPSESGDTSGSDSECDLPSCDNFSPINIFKGKSVTFSNPLFDLNDDFTSSDDESLSDEDVPKENVKAYSNPLLEFDDEYISSDVNPLFNEVLEDIENKDSYVSNLDEPAFLVTPLSDVNENECFDPGGDIDEINTFLDIDTSTDIKDAYSEASKSIPQKEKDPGSFTLPCFINSACFDNTLVDLGASVSVMPLLTYLNLGLGELAHTKLTVELADKTVKYPKGIAKNVLVRIGLVHTARTRRPQPKGNTRNARVPSTSKSSEVKTNVTVEDHRRILLLSKNQKTMSSECNNIKLAIQNDKSEIVCGTYKQCLVIANHDAFLLSLVNALNSRTNNLCANTSPSVNQKRHRTQVWKPKQVGFKERPACKPRLPIFSLKWSPSGLSFDLKGKLVASKKTNCPNDDKACTSNPQEPIRKRFPNSTVFLGRNDHIAAILGYGDLIWGNITITRVYFVEGLCHNLFLVGQFCDTDLEVAFRRNTCFIRDLDSVDLLKGNRSINLYTINLYDMASASSICLMAHATPTKSWLWHQRLSHLNFDTINDLAKNDLVSGLPKFKYVKEHLCPSCDQGKSKRASHPPKPVSNSKQQLHLLHMDLCGPMRVASINGKRYVLVIVDKYSRYMWVHFLRTKDETPEQNGVVESRNNTLVEAARPMLIFSHALLFLWDEAIATACYTQNRSIIHRRFNKTPYELIRGRLSDITYLHVFGALCYPKNDREDIGFIDTNHPSHVYKLKKALYGLKQALRAWYDKLSTFRLQNGFSKGIIDPTLFTRRFDDDILVVNQSPSGIFINQSNYMNEILKIYGLNTCYIIGTPIDIKDKLDLDQIRTPVDATKYRSMIGALMHLTSSRPDIVHATCDYGFELIGFSDTDYAGCKDSFKSTFGGAQFLGENIVSWSSKKQDCTSLSTAESEYVSLSACCAQVLWMRTQLTDYGYYFNKIPIYCDSTSAVTISCNPVQYSKTKHIAVRYHFIKEHVEKVTMEILLEPTSNKLLVGDVGDSIWIELVTLDIDFSPE